VRGKADHNWLRKMFSIVFAPYSIDYFEFGNEILWDINIHPHLNWFKRK
jgi:hypothetical protein